MKAAEHNLTSARRAHEETALRIDKERAAIEVRADTEEKRWQEKKDRLEDVLSRF